MKTKEEVIREAWGEYYESVKDKLTGIGWYNYFDLNTDKLRRQLWQFDSSIEMEQHEKMDWIRPKSLQGIEDNNGWICIKSEDDLPKEDADYKIGVFVNKKFQMSNGVYDKYEVKASFLEGKTTHYQPITKPKPPLHD